ncbi:MAG: TonB-dependent receptor domain-containing protein [bacterium]
MIRNLLRVIAVPLFASALFGGTTGKIAGRILDAETGEGLPGANVVIEGTTLGAATDVDGDYTILNVPPGLYTLRIAYIGYRAMTVRDVRVNVDFTTRIDQKVSPSTIEMAAVEVSAERNPLVRQDLTNTLVAVTSEKIAALPIDQLRDVISLQAGIVQDNDGALHIRGGRANEIAYQVNGISINNPFSSGQGVGLATNAVEEVSVSAGTFSAEYGNALSGVINFVTKDGGQKYHGSFKFWTGDHFSSRDDIFFNIGDIDLFNNSRAEWTLGGPVPVFGSNLTFFTSGVRQEDKGHLYGIRVYNPEDLLLFDGQNIFIDPFGFSFEPGPDGTLLRTFNGQPGADGDRKIVPMVTSETLNMTGKLTYKPSPKLKLTYDFIVEDGERFKRIVRQGSSFLNMYRRYRFTPDGRPKTFDNNISHVLGITHTLGSKTFYSLKFGLNLTKSRTAVFDDPFDPRYVPAPGNETSNLIVPPTGTAGGAYLAGGTDLTRSTEKSRSILAKLDVVSQILPHHELRFGAEFVHHRLELDEFTLLFDFDKSRFIIPSDEVNPNLTEFQFYTRKPLQTAFYVLDKIELAKRFILNVGLRYEYLDTRAFFNPDLAGSVDDSTGLSNPIFFRESAPKHRFSPRISLSFPISDRGIIRFSYGWFHQNPTFRDIYRNPRFEDFDNFARDDRIPTFGNANLQPERSIQYEMGLQQQFTDDLKIDLTVFYKDVNNLIEDRRVFAGEETAAKKFNVFTNISYATVKGFTFALIRRPTARGIFSATLDYTFQQAEGAFTDPLDLLIDTRTGRNTEQELVPLSFDRTHTLNGTLTLSKHNNWGFSAIASLQSGTPYTPGVPSSVQAVQFEVNSDRRPLLTNLDLKFEKFLTVQGLRFSVFMQVENALDAKNERRVHLNTGRSLTNLNETTRPTLFNNLRETIATDPDNFFPMQFLDDFYQREDFLGEPREIRWGMAFEF